MTFAVVPSTCAQLFIEEIKKSRCFRNTVSWNCDIVASVKQERRSQFLRDVMKSPTAEDALRVNPTSSHLQLTAH
jgi:hypothetical protein